MSRIFLDGFSDRREASPREALETFLRKLKSRTEFKGLVGESRPREAYELFLATGLPVDDFFFLLLSGASSSEERERILLRGASLFLSFPDDEPVRVGPRAFHRLISRLLRSQSPKEFYGWLQVFRLSLERGQDLAQSFNFSELKNLSADRREKLIDTLFLARISSELRAKILKESSLVAEAIRGRARKKATSSKLA